MAIIKDIDKCIKKFDMILMLIDGDGGAENLTRNFCCSAPMKETSKKVLILSASDGFHPNDADHYEYWKLTAEEQESVLELYEMYDFSDRFYVLSNDLQHGVLLNYVKTGIMTQEDVFQVLLNI